jgi:hypothetical protein
MSGLEFAWAYLDDLLILSTEKGFEKNLEKLELVLTQLQEASIKINAVKSFFAQTNLEYQHKPGILLQNANHFR